MERRSTVMMIGIDNGQRIKTGISSAIPEIMCNIRISNIHQVSNTLYRIIKVDKILERGFTQEIEKHRNKKTEKLKT
jgi:hypothetical protein